MGGDGRWVVGARPRLRRHPWPTRPPLASACDHTVIPPQHRLQYCTVFRAVSLVSSSLRRPPDAQYSTPVCCRPLVSIDGGGQPVQDRHDHLHHQANQAVQPAACSNTKVHLPRCRAIIGATQSRVRCGVATPQSLACSLPLIPVAHSARLFLSWLRRSQRLSPLNEVHR